MLLVLQMFIVGPIVWPVISKWYGERIDGIVPMACVFVIVTAGFTVGLRLMPLCDATF